MLGRATDKDEQLRDTSRAAFHFRLTEVVAMFLLPLLALALGVPPKRSTLGARRVPVDRDDRRPISRSTNTARRSAGSGRIDPFFALWVPFALFAALVLWMYYTIAYVPGGQPIGALERVFAKMAKAVRRWLPRVAGRSGRRR